MRLRGILSAARKIVKNTTALDLRSFSQDDWSVDAVLRNFMVIGEAAARLPDDFVARHPEVP